MNATKFAIAQRPSEIADRVGDFLKEGNLEGVISMFHPECRIFFPPTEPPHVGHDGVRKTFAGFMDARPTLKSTITSEVIVGDTALLHADWEFLDKDGTVIASGKSTEVAKKLENGGWGYFIDCPLGAPAL